MKRGKKKNQPFMSRQHRQAPTPGDVWYPHKDIDEAFAAYLESMPPVRETQEEAQEDAIIHGAGRWIPKSPTQ